MRKIMEPTIEELQSELAKTHIAYVESEVALKEAKEAWIGARSRYQSALWRQKHPNAYVDDELV